MTIIDIRIKDIHIDKITIINNNGRSIQIPYNFKITWDFKIIFGDKDKNNRKDWKEIKQDLIYAALGIFVAEVDFFSAQHLDMGLGGQGIFSGLDYGLGNKWLGDKYYGYYLQNQLSSNFAQQTTEGIVKGVYGSPLDTKDLTNMINFVLTNFTNWDVTIDIQKVEGSGSNSNDEQNLPNITLPDKVPHPKNDY
jgi:hypothetical protein